MSKIADVIKYEGDNSTFIWKHPCEDFNSLTQLIVHESQEAVFFMNGQALDLFGPGRYTLETQNIPKIGRIISRQTGDETPFHCEVYFINKTVQMSLKWGTDSKVRYIEPSSGVPLSLGASGEMNLMVSDSRKLLIKLVGTMNGITWDAEPKGFTKSICRKDDILNTAKGKMTGDETEPYKEAISLFGTIPGWKDADERKEACERKIEEINAAKEAARIEAEKKAERKAEEQRIAAKKTKDKADDSPCVGACGGMCVRGGYSAGNAGYNAE